MPLDNNNTVVDKEEVDADFPDIDLGDLEDEDTTDIPEDDSSEFSEGSEAPSKETKKESTSKESEDEVTLTEVEQEAYNQGWRPKEEYVAAGGDPKRWRPADWWLDRGELLGQQKAMERELTQMKKAFIQVAEANRMAYVKGRKDALANLKAEKKQALINSDLERVAEIEEQIDEVKEELEKAPEAEPIHKEIPKAVNPAIQRSFNTWLNDNPWYQEDEQLHNYANAVAKSYVDHNPGSTTEDALAFVTQEVKKTFPNKFQVGNKRVVQPSVNGKTASQGGGKNSGANSTANIDATFNKIVGQMDPDTRRAVAAMIRDKVLTKKEYVETYISDIR